MAAIEQACAKICRRLLPHLQQKATAVATWQATVAQVQDGSGIAPASVMLSAYGFYDGTERDKNGHTTKGKTSVAFVLSVWFGSCAPHVSRAIA